LYGNQLVAAVVAVFLAPPIFLASGLYRRVFRHSGSTETAAIVRACLLFGMTYAAIYTFVGVPKVPRTVGLLQPILLLVAMIGARATALRLLRPSKGQIHAELTTNALVYGAGETGRHLASILRRDSHVRAVGFLDDDSSLQGQTVEGLGIYRPQDVEELVRELRVSRILVAIPTASRFRRRQIVEALTGVGVEIRMLPGLAEVAKGEFNISDVRQVEIEDLLGREPVLPDPALLRRDVTGQVVMVTGGGGSIGGQLSQQLLALKPSKLLLLEASEFALYSIERQLSRLRVDHDFAEVEIVPLLGNVQDETQMRAVFAKYHPQTIYHAAAYKHVPLVEGNPLRGIENNSLGTFVAASLAREFGLNSFVLISTDKAVRPTNVMGASKRLAELIVQAFATQAGETRFCSVRFGNVLGSSGSVVPLFRKQIEEGGPLTITHPDMTRYFMTMPEAAQLVIQSGAMALGGEVFLLDMGEPVRVADLATNMIRLSGLTVRNEGNPEGDIEVRTIGLRPGEKLHEELLIDSSALPTDHPRIMRAEEPFIGLAEMEAHVEEMRSHIAANDLFSGIRLLRQLVPGYQPSVVCASGQARR
jgi:FlaA1/EpsC-like NDP-sugar epimerase